jgi:hypothetical protein
MRRTQMSQAKTINKRLAELTREQDMLSVQKVRDAGAEYAALQDIKDQLVDALNAEKTRKEVA